MFWGDKSLELRKKGLLSYDRTLVWQEGKSPNDFILISYLVGMKEWHGWPLAILFPLTLHLSLSYFAQNLNTLFYKRVQTTGI